MLTDSLPSWTEQPMYFQLAFILDRVRALGPQHPEWKTQEPFKPVLAGDARRHDQCGVCRDVSDWLSTAQHPRFNRPYTELLRHLRANGFKTSIVTRGGVEFSDDTAGSRRLAAWTSPWTKPRSGTGRWSA